MEPENQNQEGAPEATPEAPQEQSQFTPDPQPAPMPEPEPAKEGSAVGPVIGIIIIVILIVLAGFYFWGSSLKTDYANTPADGDAMEEVMEEDGDITPAGSEGAGASDDTAGDAMVEEVPVSESDAIEDLEAELDGTELDNLDAELGDIDAELNF